MTDSSSRSDPFGELEARARVRVRAAGLLAALAAAILLLAAGGALRQPLLDVFQRISPPPQPSPRVQVVAIDAESLAAIGGWPWSRYALARLTEQISDRGAVAIGFDFLFAEPDRQTPGDFVAVFRNELSAKAASEIAGLPSMDALFGEVIARRPVVLARAGVDADSYDNEDSAASTSPIPPEAVFTGPRPAAIPRYAGLLANIGVLDSRALGHGLANGPPDSDGIIRRVPLLGEAMGTLTPSLALDLVRVAEDAAEIRLEGDAAGLNAIGIGKVRVPVDAGGRVELRFAGLGPDADGRPRSAYPIYSAADLLRKGVPDDAFENAIVLVGLTAAGTSDVVTTPLEAETYGVFVQAQVVDALLRGSALARPRWAPALEWGLGLGLALLSWLVVPRAPLALVLIGAAVEVAAAFGASWLAFMNNLVIDPYPMLIPGAATSAAVVTLLFVEGRRVQARLRHALDDERVAAARISGELAAASEIQSGMLLPRSELARISTAVEIDAVLQPAKTVGGDLYDAFPFDDGRICFLVGDVTGKGVPASLFMALSKALARSLLVRPATPLDVAMREINAELSRDNRQAMAVSVLVGVLHPGEGTLHLCCAGHENPLVVDGGGTVREIELRGGPPICAAPTFPYDVETHRLESGELLFAFTDGLTEAQNPAGELFGRARTLEAVAAAAKAGSAAGAVDALVARVRAFEDGAEPTDDLTILAVRRR
ncbi:MAG: CHASE2 domain-containing protein [Phenylobacterium sp.]|nr:CHASE2 domain-containing protein [Phenylobacterium sp.]